MYIENTKGMDDRAKGEAQMGIDTRNVQESARITWAIEERTAMPEDPNNVVAREVSYNEV